MQNTKLTNYYRGPKRTAEKESSLEAIPWIIAFSSVIFLGALLHLELIALGLVFVICFIFVVCSVSTKHVWISTCLWLLLLQNLMIGVGARLGDNSSSTLSLLTQVPTLLIASIYIGTMVINAINENNKSTIEFRSKWFLILVCLMCFLFFVGGAPFTSKLVSVRNLTMFYMGYKVALCQCKSNEDYYVVMRQLANIAVVATLLGIVMMLQDVRFWESIGIYEVYIAKQSPIPVGSLGGRFYTSLNGVTDVLRMGSLYYEPVNLAYLLLAGLVASIYLWKDKIIGASIPIIIMVGLVLTFGKGGYMVLAFLIIVYLFNKLLSSLADRTMHETRFVSYLTCFVVIGIAAYAYYILVGGPVKPHFWALEQTAGSVISNPLGHGLGTGGNMSAAAGDYSKGAESAVMTIGYQIGILGIISVFMTLRDIANFTPKNNNSSAMIAFYLPLVLFAVSILQENTFTPQCIFPVMVLVAVSQRYSREGIAAGDSSGETRGVTVPISD